MKSKHVRNTLALITLFLASVIAANAQQGQLGCCTNPGAGILSCSAERLVFLDKECCPRPETNFTPYYKSNQNPSGPLNYAECSSNFFYPNSDCSTVQKCELGCCCSEQGGSIKPEPQCQGTGQTFFSGQANCNNVCITPQCSDKIDNDGNGCADYDGKDSGCSSPSDNDESGGSCVPEGLDCNNPNYSPKLTGFEVNAAKGQKKFLLSWIDECKTNALYYEVYRCEGVGCTNFEIITSTNINSLEDTSENLEFGKTYTYKVKAYYSLQSATPTAIKTGTLGDLECLNRISSNVFCMNNSAYYCNGNNKLQPQGTKCQSAEICIVSNNKPSCFPKSQCDYKEANPFGLFFTQDGCEKNKGQYKYCFYDRSHSTIDFCFNCLPSMSCYDYKTEQTCARDNCGIGNCEWSQISTQIEIGACVSKSSFNCQWCEKKGTASIENIAAYNQIFDVCTKEKSNVLSVGGFKCYFRGGKSIGCNDVVCSDYNTSDCSNVRITHDSDNNIVNPSNDGCGIKVCENIGSSCVKNADGDDQPDCISLECEKDYYAPRTTMLPIQKKGATEGFTIQVYDKTSSNSSYILRSSSANYTTFLCLEPCSFNGHPYSNFTKSMKLIISGLNIYDSNTGIKIITLSEGQNSMRYYSQDPAKNIELVKTIAFEAYKNSSGPKVFRFNVSNSNFHNEKFYTKDINPMIEIKFFEPAIVNYAKLTNIKTSSGFNLQIDGQLSDTKVMTVGQQLPEGEYKFELNAKNQNNIFMDSLFVAIIVIDNTNPKLNITPPNNAVLNSSSVQVRIVLDEESILNRVLLNSIDASGNFTTVNNKIFLANLNLSDGNKTVEVTASDFAKNPARGSSSFVIDANPTDIKMTMPKYGVSSAYTFDIVIETDNNAECRYELDNNLEFEFMNRFTTSTGIVHTISGFSRIPQNDNSTHKLYVRCNDARYGPQVKIFDVSVDTSKPVIRNIFAYPNPIIERPMTTRITAETDEPSLCKYSAASRRFEDMEGEFDNYGNSTFLTINRKSLTLDNEGNYSYFVACANKAWIYSDAATVNFTVDLSKQMRIISHMPPFFNSTSIFLAIETNKLAQCKYSETDTTAQTGELFGQPSYSHTKQLILPIGSHQYYIICKDQYLEQWSDVFKVNFTIDTTGPIMIYVNDTSTENMPPEKTCNTDRLRVKYLGQDTESGVKEYAYAILKNNQPIIGMISTFVYGEWIWVENLSLQDNTQYYFNVMARNYLNIAGEAKRSNGIMVDTSYCLPAARCGDSLINQAGEECDTNTFGIVDSCTDFTNFIGGTLKCAGNCRLDTSECIKIPDCGNGQLDPGESCDGSKFGTINSCNKLNATFTGGTLKCSSTCQLDTSSCIEKPKCGNSHIDAGESCDGLNLGPLTGGCIDYNPSTFTGGNLSCTACNLDTSKCQGVQGACGDGIININEACDGINFGRINTCTDYSDSFVGGSLGCTSACRLNTTGCIEKPKCGNNAIDAGESCDGANLGPLTGNCAEYSTDFNGGNIKCSSCKLDTNECRKSPTCGNSRIDTGELCDGSIFANLTNLACSSFKETFVNGTLTCDSSCRISTRNCGSNATITPPINCRERGECAINELCSDNSNCKSRFCSQGKCAEATCSDNTKNQDEADVDCGGVCSTKCQNSRSCKLNSDCQSGSCSFGKCSDIEICSDGRLSAGEADVDCGGPCPVKCNEGRACVLNDDCSNGLECVSGQCASISTEPPPLLDKDGDGLPDEWELQNGLNPDDPTDADMDFDNDGLTNKEEYEMLNVYSSGTDPNNIDTDNDGYSDKEEIDNGTDPTNPEDFPKSSTLKIILFIVGALILVGGFGYLGYVAVQKRKEEEFEFARRTSSRQTQMQPRAPVPQQRQTMPFQRTIQPQRQQPQLSSIMKEKGQLRDMERKTLFESFGKQQPPVPKNIPAEQQKTEKITIKEKKIAKVEKKPATRQVKQIKTIKTAQQKITKKTQDAKPTKIKQSKPREDVFVKLKQVTTEIKKESKRESKPRRKNATK